MISIGAYSKPDYSITIDSGLTTTLDATDNVSFAIDITKYIFGVLDTSVQVLTESSIAITTQDGGTYLIAEE